MRAIGFGLLGAVAGAACGLLLAFLVAWLWSAAGLPLPDEPKPALGLFTRLVYGAVPLGAAVGAWWFVRRAAARRGGRAALAGPLVIAALVIAYLLATFVG